MALQSSIKDSFGKLVSVLDSFTEDQINQIPFEGSWTAGQVGEHLTKGLSGLPRLAAGKTQPADRPFDAKAETIKSIFLDFSTKLQSPEYLIPSNEHHSKQKLISELRQIEKDILDVDDRCNLTHLCLDFEFPQMGTLTIYEWIVFTLAHAQRHTHQLENIHARLNS